MGDDIIIFKDELFVDFADSDRVILDILFHKKYNGVCPKCKWGKPYVKTPKKRSFHCTRCAFQIFPCAGTIFEKSLLPLGWWLLIITVLMQEPNLHIDDFMWEWLRDGNKFFVRKEIINKKYLLVRTRIIGEYINVSKLK